MTRILVIDDEPEMVRGLRDNLSYEGYEVLTAREGREGLATALKELPDLIILDIMMPGMSGWDVCRELRKKEVHIPIIMLTARGQEADTVMGLELGADDYITKPFSVRELLARVGAVMRRPGQRSDIDSYAFGSVRIDFKQCVVFRDTRQVSLTRKELDIMRYFVAHQGEVLSRERLLDEVWGYERFPTTRTVDNHILKLRQKLEDDPENPRFIQTVHGIGYRFVGA
ncbi:MAG: response regulator transcription factor [candidate division NC10 bacterium]|nr:response regulator transcription factor [candidate division NC10 bacterium]